MQPLACVEEPRLHRPLGQTQQTCDVLDALSLDGGQNQDDTKPGRQFVDGRPQAGGPFALDRVRPCITDRSRLETGATFVRLTPAVAPLPIEGHPPGHADDPGSKTLRVAQALEAAVRTEKDLLRDVFGVELIAQHAVGNPHGQGGGLRQAVAKLTGEVIVGTHQGAGPSIDVFMHRAHVQDAGHGQTVRSAPAGWTVAALR